ncbi:MAG TPA: S41 family peptidase, partial [Flavobacteriales bacterium]
SRYKEADLDFPQFVRTAFDSIRTRECQSLIIDIRENGGGSEGNEDLLFAELNTGPYVKYRSVQASAFTFSFLRHTDLRRKADARELEIELRREHAAAPDGRLLRRPGVMEPAPPRPDAFTGQVYVLTSGWTYSGGAEFASLMRQHTGAIFIGEEVGGAFGGNTSGHMLTLTLPHSHITVEVPILYFNLAVDRQALDRGVLPDIALQPTIGQFLRGEDVVMEQALRSAGAVSLDPARDPRK